MKLLVWTPFVYNKKGFLRDNEGNPYIPGKLIKTAIADAMVYYYTKKDKEIENLIKTYLLKLKTFNFEEVAKEVRKKVYEKYSYLQNIRIPEKIYLPEKEIYKETIEVFDLEKWMDVEDFKTEVFKGVIEIESNLPEPEKIKSACHSFCEALLKMEMSMLKEHPLVETFYQPYLNKIKTWQLPLRLGWWTKETRKARLLFFWRIKEVRESILKKFKIDIQIRYIFFSPREHASVGWGEIQP